MKNKIDIIPLLNIPFFTKWDDISSSLSVYDEGVVVIKFDKTNNRLFNNGLTPVEIDDFSVIMVTGGECTIHVNYIPYNLHRNMFIVLRTKLLISKIFLSEGFTGYLLIVKRDLMRTALENNIFPTKEIFSRRTFLPAIKANDDDFVRLDEFMIQLIRNISLEAHMYQRTLIQNSLSNIHHELWNMTAKLSLEEVSLGNQPDTQEKLTLQFIHMIHNDCKKRHEVLSYADELGVSATYLTRIIKKVTGKTGSEWINEALVNEAKLLLHKPQITIQTIAAELNFSEQAAFSKFFKKNTGLSPLEYRNGLHLR